MELDLSVTVTALIAGGIFVLVCVFFAIIFYQEIQEFKDNPLLLQAITKNDPELRSISMSPQSKVEKDRRKSPAPPKPKKPEIILSPSNLPNDIPLAESSSSRSSAVQSSGYSYSCQYSQGVTNEAFNESEVI